MPVLGVLAVLSCGDARLSGPDTEAAQAAALAAAAAQADGEEVPDGDAVARYVQPPGTNGVERATSVIGPEGGSVRLHDFEVIVPPGAVSSATRFEIMILPEPAREQHAWARFHPHNQAFAVPVTLRVPLTTTESAGADSAHVLWWNRNVWEELPTTLTDDGRLETTTDHFSVYATQRMRGITMVGG